MGAGAVSAEGQRLLARLTAASEGPAARYAFTGIVGEGGMGTVLRATQRDLDRVVAVKCVRLDRFGDDEGVARFKREAAMLSRVEHPGVVRLYTVEEWEGLLLIVSEFVEGVSLHERLDGGPLRWATAVELVSDLARTLSDLHGQGIVHRDIKSENVLLPGGGGAKLIDFGLAKDFTGRSGPGNDVTRAGEFFGTPAYLAPEVIRRQVVSPAGDVYALGILLYECLVGEPPFLGPPMEVLRAHVRDPVPPPSTVGKGVPRELDRIVAGATAKDPRERTPSAAAFADELERAASAYRANRKDRDRRHRSFSSGFTGTDEVSALLAPALARARLRRMALAVALILGVLVALVLVRRLGPPPSPGETPTLCRSLRFEGGEGSGPVRLVLHLEGGPATELLLTREAGEVRLPLGLVGGGRVVAEWPAVRGSVSSLRFEGPDGASVPVPPPILAAAVMDACRAVPVGELARNVLTGSFASATERSARTPEQLRLAFLGRLETVGAVRRLEAALDLAPAAFASPELSSVGRWDLVRAIHDCLPLELPTVGAKAGPILGVEAAVARVTALRELSGDADVPCDELRTWSDEENSLMPVSPFGLGLMPDDLRVQRARMTQVDDPTFPALTVDLSSIAGRLSRARRLSLVLRVKKFPSPYVVTADLGGGVVVPLYCTYGEVENLAGFFGGTNQGDWGVSQAVLIRDLPVEDLTAAPLTLVFRAAAPLGLHSPIMPSLVRLGVLLE